MPDPIINREFPTVSYGLHQPTDFAQLSLELRLTLSCWRSQIFTKWCLCSIAKRSKVFQHGSSTLRFLWNFLSGDTSENWIWSKKSWRGQQRKAKSDLNKQLDLREGTVEKRGRYQMLCSHKRPVVCLNVSNDKLWPHHYENRPNQRRRVSTGRFQ